MSTLKHLDLALIDLRDRLTRELQFSHDAEAQITAALDTVCQGLEHLERSIHNAFAERNRALEAALGTSAPAQAAALPVPVAEPAPAPMPTPEDAAPFDVADIANRPAKKRAA
jgi:hypothetical protein